MGNEGIGPRVAFDLFGIPISETVTVTWLVMAIMTVFCILATRKMRRVPRGFQLVGEVFVNSINKLTTSNMGQECAGFAPYIGTLFMFLALANIMGIFGMRPPTADLNVTLCLSIITFILTLFFGIKKKGVLGYGKSYFEPLPLLFPLNLIGELVNPISLGLRIFVNMLAGMMLMSMIYQGLGAIMGPVFQTGIPVAFHFYFDLFAGLLQSFIFTMLTMVYISSAME